MNDMKARARREDPATSHEAAQGVESSGKAHDQRSLCLERVKRCPGETAAEIAAALHIERHIPSRRLPELRDAGLVKNGTSRVCGVMGRQSMTWLPETERPVSETQKDLFV
jgi:predicted ArsR family transcriptional regulator